MAQHSFMEKFRAARRVGTPLIGIRTPDQSATMGSVLAAYAGREVDSTPAILCYDIIRGVNAVSSGTEETGTAQQAVNEAAMKAIEAEPGNMPGPIDVLSLAAHLPRRTILFFLNADRFLDQAGFVQAISNLRDVFKANKRSLVLLAPSMTLPACIAQDVLMLDEPYPDREQLKEIVLRVHHDSKFPVPKPEIVERACDALSGLAAFPAEQAAFMSADKDEKVVDLDWLWDRKRQTIEQQQGAAVWRGEEKFEHVCGSQNFIRFARMIIKGKQSIAVVLFLDELEKMFAGIKGDLSGTSQKMFGMLLTWMQNVRAIGLLLLGPPGTGKSLLAKCIGNEAGVPTIAANIARMEGSLIGSSEQNMEGFLKMVEAVAGGKTICVVGTCNDDTVLPAELLRRFKRGTFFIDLPDKKELAAAWERYMKVFKIKKQELPASESWTAAEVEQCCDMANDMNMTLVEAAEFVVPVAESRKEGIERLRQFASGRFISANNSGKYRMPVKQTVGQRREVD